MDNIKKPQRAVVLDIKIETDTVEGLADKLRDIAIRIDLGEISGPNGISASPSGSYSYALSKSDIPTHAQYFEELTKYLAVTNKAQGDGDA